MAIEALENRKYGFITTRDRLEQFAAKLIGIERIAFDVETSGLDPRNDVIAGFSVCPRPGVAFYIPIRHTLVAEQVSPDTAWQIMRPVLTHCKIIGHNIKFDDRMVRFDEDAGFDLNIDADTMAMAYCTGQFENLAHGEGEESRVSAGLKNVVRTCYQHQMLEIRDLFPGVGKKSGSLLDFTKLTLSADVRRYTCEDVDFTYRLYLDLWPKVKDLFVYKLEASLIKPNADIEDVGILVDLEAMSNTVDKLNAACEEARKVIVSEVRERTGKPIDFDPSSPHQCGQVLFDELKLPVTKRSKKTDRASTDKIALEQLAKSYPVVRNILTYRQMQKQVSGFFGTLPDYVYPDTRRIHCDYLQCHVGTGRFASADPNLQNLSKPKRWDLLATDGSTIVSYTANLRDAFIADPDCYFIESDYSQIEARILASVTGDVQLLDVFLHGKDYHIKTAVGLHIAVSEERCTDDQRYLGKRYNYAFAYGLGPKGLAQREGIAIEVAQELYRLYFECYAGLKPWTDRAIKEYRAAGGVVHTVYGRIRHVPEYYADNPYVRQKGERSAANTIIQGSAADIQKMSLVRLVKRCKATFGCDEMQVCMHTHDSNVCLVHRSIKPADAIAIIRDAMLFPVPLKVQMDVDHSIGFRLGSMVKVSTMSHIDFDKRLIVGKKKVVETENQTAVAGTDDVEIVKAGGNLVVKMNVQPSADHGLALKALLESFPGPNIITLRTPQGDLQLTNLGTSLGISDAAKFQLVIPCEVLVDAANVSLATLGVSL